MLPNAITVINGKGGVGKTSTAANLAGLAATSGRRVLAVDLDPQGDLSLDLGFADGRPSEAHRQLGITSAGAGDDGRSLAEALAGNGELTLLSDVRPGLDVAAGGAWLEDVSELPGSWWDRRGFPPALAVDRVLAPIAGDYDLIVVDSPPGVSRLQDMALAVAGFAVVPTRPDRASVRGLIRVADAFAAVAEHNPSLRLLGVVVFGVNPSARRVQADTRASIAADLGGVAPVFDAIIRYLEVPAADCRALGVLAHEYDTFVSRQPRFPAPGYREAGRWSKAAPQLAADYEALAVEILEAHAAALGLIPAAS